MSQSHGTEKEARKSGGPDARTVELVQASWAKVAPIADTAATLFYGRLFELDPSLRLLFKSDLGEQKMKLMQTLAVAVDGLGNTAKLVPVLRHLGARHVGYRVSDRHYDVVGEALLWTLRQGLGEDFTPEVEAAWTEIYGLVASVMKQGAAEQRAGVTTAVAGG
jgi:hemoglobin-like flavoprotein